MDLVPPGLPVLANLDGEPRARQWLRGLPELIAEIRDEFGLTLAPPLHGGSCSWVAPATLPDGTAAIVKIGWPHREMLGEPAALRHWNGNGAVRLLRHDPARHALVLAPCVPGIELGRSPGTAEERLEIGCTVLHRLWTASPTGGTARPSGDFERLADVTADWAHLTEERMDRLNPGYDPGLVAEGAGLLRSLPLDAGHRDVLLHGDFNPGNILSAGDGWLAIDPKPMWGDAAYDPWPLLQQIDNPFSYAFPATHLANRLARLAQRLDLTAERMAAWAVARLVEGALYEADTGDVPAGAEALAHARVLADL
jgi:streptomycin 6-kinase